MKKLRLTKKQYALTGVLLALALCCAGCAVFRGVVAGRMSSQLAAERFAGESETRFAQVSAFFPEGKSPTLSGIYAFRESLPASFAEAGLETPDTGALWVDAYSAQAEVTVAGKKGSATVTALGVGGDWFFFHPLRLRSGSYISEGDLMHDRVLVDEELAWQLYGGVELAGEYVVIAGERYVIAGVVRREDDAADKRAMGERKSGLYMYYDALDALTEEETEVIGSYELCCADPIKGFAESLLQKGFADSVVQRNTGRFSVLGGFRVIGALGERSMRLQSLTLPYWENAARYTEDVLALLLALALLFGLFPGAFLLFTLIRAIARGWKKLREELLPLWWEKLTDAIRAKQREAILKKENKRE